LWQFLSSCPPGGSSHAGDIIPQGHASERAAPGAVPELPLFPKTNSFIKGTAQPLAEVEEFCGKIRAAKDTQQCPDFVVVARVESLIAGWGVGEALTCCQELLAPDEFFAETGRQ
jgi:hypothetical protein